jgi:hypothetical protein
MGPLAGTLASISMGAVYMGALTYRQRAEPDRPLDRAGTWHQDAELLRLHDVGGARSHSAVRSADASSDFAAVEIAVRRPFRSIKSIFRRSRRAFAVCEKQTFDRLFDHPEPLADNSI